MSLVTIRDAIRDELVDAGSNSYALVGTRVFYPPFPQGRTFPLLTLQTISGRPEHTMGTAAGNDVFYRIQISAWSPRADAAHAALEAAIADLDAASLLGVETMRHVKFRSLNPELYEPEAGLYMISADFELVQ